jgi:HSP20 family protein
MKRGKGRAGRAGRQNGETTGDAMAIELASDATFGNLQRQMQRLMENMQKNFFNFCPSETWTPNVNLYESERAYLVVVDLAGVEKEKIDVVVSEQKLMLRGQRTVPTPPEPEAEGGDGPRPPMKLRVHMMEIDHGMFSREVELPADVVHEQISASHRNGLLWIEIPKK